MTMKQLTDFLDEKINENDNFIKITFYEIRVKYNLSEQETELFIELATNRFNNLGYNVYCTTETYKYKNQTNIVQPNELMVAIRKREELFL